MRTHIRHKDINVERTPSGGLELSAMHPDGYRVSQLFYFYAVKEARKMFHAYANGME